MDPLANRERKSTDRYESERLIHDPVHGYIPFVSRRGLPEGEAAEEDLIRHPWVQRLKQIHQLQTAPWIFPSAEHTRFPHVLGVMHLASRAVAAWYDSLAEACPEGLPSRAYVESLCRMAGLLHDVGHGPFSHFFDDQWSRQYGITHEDIGGAIITGDLAETLRSLRRNPSGELAADEQLDPAQIAWLIKRPTRSGDAYAADEPPHPQWLQRLRALFSGIYTVDNMDFVLRDAYVSGYLQSAFDLQRLLHYSFFTPRGLTIHIRGLPALVAFIETRASLFRTIYFHRQVRAIDLEMKEIFGPTMAELFPKNPIENLGEYQLLTEFGLLAEVRRWATEEEGERRRLGQAWVRLAAADLRWRMVAERTMSFGADLSERQTILSEPDLVERRLRENLPPGLGEVPLKFDTARHYLRPRADRPTAHQNWLFDPSNSSVRRLDEDRIFRSLPTSFTILRVYAESLEDAPPISRALDRVLGDSGDDATNM